MERLEVAERTTQLAIVDLAGLYCRTTPSPPSPPPSPSPPPTEALVLADMAQLSASEGGARWREVGAAAYMLWDTMRAFGAFEREFFRRAAWWRRGVGVISPLRHAAPEFYAFWRDVRIRIETELLGSWQFLTASIADPPRTLTQRERGDTCATPHAAGIAKRIHRNLSLVAWDYRRRPMWMQVQLAIIDFAGRYCQPA